MYFPRRLISLLLIAAILFSLSCEAFAETITLPAALEEIGEDAFYGDESLDEVVVPYGATAIGPRAFAYSGVKRITIPDTVTEIAEDAFEGTVGLTIMSPTDCRAYEFAEEFGFYWQNCSGQYRSSQVRDFFAQVDKLDNSRIGSILTDEIGYAFIPTDGIADSEFLTLVNQYNELENNIQAGLNSYNQEIGQLCSAFEAILDDLSDYGFSISEEAVTLNSLDMSISLPSENSILSDSDYEIISYENDENGNLEIVAKSGDRFFTLRGDESGLFLSENQLSQNSFALYRSDAYLSNTDEQELEDFALNRSTELFDMLKNGFNALKAIVSSASNHNDTHLEQAEEQLRIVENFSGDSDPHTVQRMKREAESKIASFRRIRSIIENVSQYFGPISLLFDGLDLFNDSQNWHLLQEYAEHGHPTNDDSKDPELLKIAKKLASDIRNAQRIYTYDALSNLLFIAIDIVDTAAIIELMIPGAQGVAIAQKASAMAARREISTLLNQLGAVNNVVVEVADKKRDDVLRADLRLHGAVAGFVKGKEGNPIADVCVWESGGTMVKTDSTGFYSMLTSAGEHTIWFSKSGYTTQDQTVIVSNSQTTPLDITLKKPSTVFRGVVKKEETGRLQSNVSISADGSFMQNTNSRGEFNITTLSPGTHTLVFSKAGLETKTFTVNLTEFDPETTSPASRTILMKEAETHSISGKVTDSATGAALSGVTVTLDGSRTASTGADGQYSFSDVAQGAHSLRFEKSGYDVATAQLAEGQYTRNQPLAQKTYTLSGTVRNRYGAALPGVTVTLDGSRTATTGAGGKYSFSKVSAGTHGLSFSLSGYNPFSDTISITDHDYPYDAVLRKADVPANANNFPDPNFRAWLFQRFDTDGSGGFSEKEIEAVTYINCSDMGFRSVQGIEIFHNLEKLDCQKNNLTSIDVSGLTALRSLICNDNQVSSLNLSGCSALSQLWCQANQLTTLNLSGCSALEQLLCSENQLTTLKLSGYSALSVLYCCNNQLTTLNLSGCSALEKLLCSDNQLTTLNLSGYSALSQLWCQANQLTTLNLSGCSALEELLCSENQLTTLNLSGCSALELLLCSDNQLATLNLSGCSALTNLECWENQLTSLNISGCSAMTNLECSYNQLTALDVSGCEALTDFNYYYNPIKSLNLSGCTSLVDFECTSVGLESLDVSGCTSLPELNCQKNQLTYLNVSGCTSLERLNAHTNQLSALDVSGLTALTELYCQNNQLTYLNLSGCTSLSELQVEGGVLTTLNVSNCINLERLSCHHNSLTSLNLSGCRKLKTLYCYNNQLKSIDVSDCPLLETLEFEHNLVQNLDLSGYSALKQLACNNNPLTSLNLSNCSSLPKLHAGGMQLTSLILSGCSALTELVCSDNKLTSLDVSDCTMLENLHCFNNKLTRLNVSGCNALTELICFNNALTTLDVSDCTALVKLNASDCQLTSIDASGCTALERLLCYNNKLTSLDVSGLTALTELICYENQLTSLDVSGCTALERLNAETNQLPTLDVSECTALTKLFCAGNQLTSLDVSGLTALTELVCAGNQLTSIDVSDCPNLTDANIQCDSGVQIIRK